MMMIMMMMMDRDCYDDVGKLMPVVLVMKSDGRDIYVFINDRGQ